MRLCDACNKEFDPEEEGCTVGGDQYINDYLQAVPDLCKDCSVK